MLTNIFVRIGDKNKDLTELDDKDLFFYLIGLDQKSIYRLILLLIRKLKEN